MSTRLRRAALPELRVPEHVLIVNHLPLPSSGDVSRRARGGYEGMRSLGPNDGLALTLDEILPGPDAGRARSRPLHRLRTSLEEPSRSRERS